MSLKETVTNDMKDAMRAHDSAKLSCLRLLLAAVKQREVDERIEPTDDVVISVIGKLVKQRRDSVEQYTAAKYLPQQMSEDEIRAIVEEAVKATGASGMAAMGKVMGVVKGKCAGKADMGKVSAVVKAVLSA